MRTMQKSETELNTDQFILIRFVSASARKSRQICSVLKNRINIATFTIFLSFRFRLPFSDCAQVELPYEICNIPSRKISNWSDFLHVFFEIWENGRTFSKWLVDRDCRATLFTRENYDENWVVVMSKIDEQGYSIFPENSFLHRNRRSKSDCVVQ